MTSEQRGGGYIVGPVIKALQVLDYVGESGREVTLTEVANALRIPKTTVFRYLQTLSATAFLKHDIRSDRYGIGPRFRSLARIDRSLSRLREVAMPVMRDLNLEFNERINLGLECGGRIVYIEIVESRQTLRVQGHIGTRYPMHTTSIGKAILAYLGETEREKVLSGALCERTYRSILDASILRDQINQIRLRGYSIEVGETEDILMCIGVPILDALSFPIAGLSLSAPVQRKSDHLVSNAIVALKEAGKKIAIRLRQELL